jgi:hypothetical protein
MNEREEITEIEKRIATLEGQLTGLREALSILRRRAVGNGAINKSTPVAHEPMKSRIRSTSNRDAVRRAISKAGDTFTPSDLEKFLVADGIKLRRVILTTTLFHLKSNSEIFPLKNGIGGVEPVYSRVPLRSKREDVNNTAE